MRAAEPSNEIAKKVLPIRGSVKISTQLSFIEFFRDSDPRKALQSGKIMAKAWARLLQDEVDALCQIQTFIFQVIDSYWTDLEYDLHTKPLPVFFQRFEIRRLDESVYGLARAIGKSAAKLDVIEASYQLGNIYTAMLPESLRAAHGIFYTPPALTNRLLDMVEATGVQWDSAKVIDPACGGGAFLAPIALRMVEKLRGFDSKTILQYVESHLTGFDIDHFGGWLTQVFLEIALKKHIDIAGTNIKQIVKVCNSLEQVIAYGQYDAVIGNPPYGRLRLSPELRGQYKRSLYGHANLYGVFTDLALRLTKQGGTIGFLTPTSFLSGEYFKNLRATLRTDSSLFEVDFVSFRKGVFEDVLQETMLATYLKPAKKLQIAQINQITTSDQVSVKIHPIDKVTLPASIHAPWILPRLPSQSQVVLIMQSMKQTLKDWGYAISTGPLVWNRHKSQLYSQGTKGMFPIIWAESITPDGRFFYKTNKRNHLPLFKFMEGDQWLITSRPCVLLQRTTAKEQHKRLIAGVLTAEFIAQKGSVVIENHLNIIASLGTNDPKISLETLSTFLNSKIVNEAFRCVSGSVAVSAYELESLPLPHYKRLKYLEILVKTNAPSDAVEKECQRIYSIN